MDCDKSKVHRQEMMRTTDNRASGRAEILYVYPAGPMESGITAGSRYVLMIVDSYSCFNVIRFLKTNGDCNDIREIHRDIHRTIKVASLKGHSSKSWTS